MVSTTQWLCFLKPQSPPKKGRTPALCDGRSLQRSMWQLLRNWVLEHRWRDSCCKGHYWDSWWNLQGTEGPDSRILSRLIFSLPWFQFLRLYREALLSGNTWWSNSGAGPLCLHLWNGSANTRIRVGGIRYDILRSMHCAQIANEQKREKKPTG